jgi:sec-independent protein translocase protein TatB
MLVVLAIAVMVIGPKELPRALYAAGKTFRKIKVFTGDIQASLDKILHDEELDEITRTANSAGGDNLDFQIEQQKAVEERRQRLSASNNDPEKPDGGTA